MVQNAMMVAGLRSASADRGAAFSTAGGVVRAGAGIPYATGRVIGAMARVGRTAAYQLAARRGRA